MLGPTTFLKYVYKLYLLLLTCQYSHSKTGLEPGSWVLLRQNRFRVWTGLLDEVLMERGGGQEAGTAGRDGCWSRPVLWLELRDRHCIASTTLVHFEHLLWWLLVNSIYLIWFFGVGDRALPSTILDH
jgi:hypothetical protein